MFGKKKDKNSEFSPDIMAFKNALEEVRFTPEVEHDAELINMFDEELIKLKKVRLFKLFMVVSVIKLHSTFKRIISKHLNQSLNSYMEVLEA